MSNLVRGTRGTLFMRCDIIIPVWNQLEATKECIDSIVKHTDYPYRLILIDNGSDAGSAG